jgi:hypothetical protein
MASRQIPSNKFIFSILFEQGLNQLELQSTAVESMEAKTGYLMAGEGVLLTILVTFATQAKQFPLNTDIVLGIIGLLISLGFCIGTLWNRHLQIGIGIEDFYRSYLTKSEEEIRFRALNVVNHDYNVNKEQLTKKALFFQIALVVFGVSLYFLINGSFVNYIWYTGHMDNTKSTNPVDQQDSGTIAQTESQTEQNQNWNWTPVNQNLGTIAADVIKGNEDRNTIKK